MRARGKGGTYCSYLESSIVREISVAQSKSSEEPEETQNNEKKHTNKNANVVDEK